MRTYFALIQLGQRHHQSARYRGYHSKKLRDQQDGRMKKHLRSFMISQFKRTFRTPGLSIISLLILSNPHLYERTGNELGENLQIKLALTCEG